MLDKLPESSKNETRLRVMEQTLLLNATYEPLRVVHWQKAITLWCQGKVEIVAVYDEVLSRRRSPAFAVRRPAPADRTPGGDSQKSRVV